MSQLLLFFFVFSSSFFFFFFFFLLSFFFFFLSSFSFLVADGTQGLPDQGHKERKRRKKWRKRAKLLLSPFLPSNDELQNTRMFSPQTIWKTTGCLCSAPPKMPTPTSCKEWTNVSGQIRTQKNECQNISSPSSQLALPTLFLVSLFSDSKFCVDSKDRSYLMFFIHGGVPFSSIFLRF